MKNQFIIFSIAIVCAFLSACDNSTPFVNSELTSSTVAAKTLTPAMTSTPSQIPGLVKVVEMVTELDFRRNDKVYTVTIARAHFNLINRDLYNLTPPPIFPENPSDAIWYWAKIKEVSDLDNDGEQEFTVLLNKCTNFDYTDSGCRDFVSYIKIYKYNPEKDEYFVLDEFEVVPEKIESDSKFIY
jgi:hypothetical protein